MKEESCLGMLLKVDFGLCSDAAVDLNALTHSSRVCDTQPILGAIDTTAAHGDGSSSQRWKPSQSRGGYSMALTMSSTTFFASPKTIIVLSM